MKAEEAFNLGKETRDKQSKKYEELEQSFKEENFKKIMKDIERYAKSGLTSMKYKGRTSLLFHSKINYLVYDDGINTLEEMGYICDLDMQDNILGLEKITVTISWDKK